MNIAVDKRCLMDVHRTGVGEYTYELLDALFEEDKKNEYILFYNSWRDVSDVVPKWKQNNVHYIVTKFPNKIFSLLVWLKLLKLDYVIEKRLQTQNIDYFFSIQLYHNS